jgi:hypothetical protein
MRFKTIICFLIIFSAVLKGQTLNDNISGRVSFASSQNIYVKFKSTEGISKGDTLFTSSAGRLIPVLIVNNLSSTSCVCSSITAKSLPVSQEILGKRKTKPVKAEIKASEKSINKSPVNITSSDTSKNSSYKKENKQNKQKINGSISAYSYSDFSNTSAKNSTRLRYNYTLDARNIGNSKFSVENYITFRHKIGDWSAVKSDIFNALKVYTFAVRYEPDKTTRITLGRAINYRISSIGAMDGLQVEKTFNKFTVGAVGGFRPDYMDYGFNSKLFQYGGYVAYDTKSADKYSETSLAFMEQMNNLKTDRRFIYFQHSNAILKNVFFFSTFEVDLYKVKHSVPQNTLDLTSLYLSLRYRITKNFSIMASYDQRKNVLFYETYKSLIDSVLQSEKRESFRLQANYRITNNITLGVESSYRFLKSDPHPSRNIYGYLTYYQIPALKISLTLNGTYLEPAFMNGRILGANISKDLLNSRFQASLGYNYTEYTLSESKLNILQNTGEISLFWLFTKKMSFSANYEGTFEKHDKYSRVYLMIRKRF